MKRITAIILLICAAITAGCSGTPTPVDTTTVAETETTAETTTTAEVETTTESTTTTVAATMAATITDRYEPPGASLDIIRPVEVVIEPMPDAEIDQDMLARVKEKFFNEVFLKETEGGLAQAYGYGFEYQGVIRTIESPEQIAFNCWYQYDFDRDGEMEYMVAVSYPIVPNMEYVGNGTFLVDGDNMTFVCREWKNTVLDFRDAVCIYDSEYSGSYLFAVHPDAVLEYLTYSKQGFKIDPRGFVYGVIYGLYDSAVVLYTIDHKFEVVGWETMPTEEFTEYAKHNDVLRDKVSSLGLNLYDINEVITIGYINFGIMSNIDKYYHYICLDDVYLGYPTTSDSYLTGVSLNKLYRLLT